MDKRKKILVSILTLSFFIMTVFIFAEHGGSKDQLLFFVIFGIVLVAFAVIGLRIERSYFKGKSILKILFGSIVLAFALMLFSSVVAMPFVGYKGFEFMLGGNAGVIWLILAVVVSPISARYIR